MEVRAKQVIEGQESGHKQIGRWSKYLTADGLDIGGRSRLIPPTYMAGGMELPCTGMGKSKFKIITSLARCHGLCTGWESISRNKAEGKKGPRY